MVISFTLYCDYRVVFVAPQCRISGAVLMSDSGDLIEEIAVYLGPAVTNNVAGLHVDLSAAAFFGKW